MNTLPMGGDLGLSSRLTKPPLNVSLWTTLTGPTVALTAGPTAGPIMSPMSQSHSPILLLIVAETALV
jgi:hypothetical protein